MASSCGSVSHSREAGQEDVHQLGQETLTEGKAVQVPENLSRGESGTRHLAVFPACTTGAAAAVAADAGQAVVPVRLPHGRAQVKATMGAAMAQDRWSLYFARRQRKQQGDERGGATAGDGGPRDAAPTASAERMWRCFASLNLRVLADKE